MPKTPILAIVPRTERTSIREGSTMNPILRPDAGLNESPNDEALIHAWHVEQLQRLGLPRLLAVKFAERVDWHELAELVARGCPPELALEIVR
jgi:hypothetical protein